MEQQEIDELQKPSPNEHFPLLPAYHSSCVKRT